MWLVSAFLLLIYLIANSVKYVAQGVDTSFIVFAFLKPFPLVLFLVLAHILEKEVSKSPSLKNAKIMRYTSFAMVLLISILFAEHIFNLVKAQWHIKNFIWAIWNIGLGVAFILIFLKTLYFCLTHNVSQIVAGSYLRQYFELVDSQKYQESKEKLYKAHEYDPNSIFILGQLAASHQLVDSNPDAADECIGKARWLLGMREYKKVEKAAFEHNVGLVLFQRGLFGPAIECFRKAANLEPKPFRINNLNEKLETAKKLVGYDIN